MQKSCECACAHGSVRRHGGFALAAAAITVGALAIAGSAVAATVVTTSEIANYAVTNPKIATSAVSNTKIANRQVTGSKIALSTVASGNLTAAVRSELGHGSLTTSVVSNSGQVQCPIGTHLVGGGGSIGSVPSGYEVSFNGSYPSGNGWVFSATEYRLSDGSSVGSHGTAYAVCASVR